MRQRTPWRRIPEGMSDSTVRRPPLTRVWPALWPPWKRATAAARSVSRSTTLPLPSSPHWVPMTTTNLPMRAYRATNRMSTPTSMLPRPATRNSRSRTSMSRASARFTPCGLMNGPIPSNTRNRPNAAARSWRFTPPASLGSPALVRVLEVLEELPVGSQYQQVAVLAERALVGLETAVEGVELGVLRVGVRIGLAGRRIALALDVQRIALGVGENLGAAPLGLGADTSTGALPFGAQPPGGLGEALLHALEDARRNVVRQIDALHAHVDQLDAEAGAALARLPEHLARDRGPLCGHDLLQRALRNHALDPVFDDVGEALAGQLNPAAGCRVELHRLLDAPLDVEVDDQPAVVVGEEGLAVVRLREDAPVELGHHVPGPLVVQPRHVVAALDGSKLGDDGDLGLAHREERESREHQRHGQHEQHRKGASAHQRCPRPRASMVTCSGCSLAAPPAGCSPASGAAPVDFSSSLSIGR